MWNLGLILCVKLWLIFRNVFVNVILVRVEVLCIFLCVFGLLVRIDLCKFLNISLIVWIDNL